MWSTLESRRPSKGERTIRLFETNNLKEGAVWRVARQQTDKHHATIGLRFPLLGSVKRQWNHW
jgi:hypothetical protein